MTDDVAALATLLRTKYASDNPHAEDIARALERLSADLAAAQERIARLEALAWTSSRTLTAGNFRGMIYRCEAGWKAVRSDTGTIKTLFPDEPSARAALEAAAMEATR